MKRYVSQNILMIATVAAVAGVLNFAWEWAHMGLYGGCNTETTGIFIMSAWATAGDIMYVVGAVLLASLFKRNISWIKSPHIYDIVGLASIGLGIALYVEYKALVFGTWFYLDAMPIIPWFEVGLSPVAQMTILLPLSVVVTALIWKYIQRY